MRYRNLKTCRSSTTAGAALFLSILCLSACTPGPSVADLDIPSTPLLTNDDQHAVIRGAYVRLRSDPERLAPISLILRAGDVLPIVGRTPYEDDMLGRRAPWYRLRVGDSEGWVFGDTIDVYATEQRALDAARSVER